jgi:hypothetical protein
MHTHGLHVSSKGVEDGWAYYSDDIFAAVNPGNTQLFKFTIPDDHMGPHTLPQQAAPLTSAHQHLLFLLLLLPFWRLTGVLA